MSGKHRPQTRILKAVSPPGDNAPFPQGTVLSPEAGALSVGERKTAPHCPNRKETWPRATRADATAGATAVNSPADLRRLSFQTEESGECFKETLGPDCSSQRGLD
jgi:hypothetical protein